MNRADEEPTPRKSKFLYCIYMGMGDVLRWHDDGEQHQRERQIAELEPESGKPISHQGTYRDVQHRGDQGR